MIYYNFRSAPALDYCQCCFVESGSNDCNPYRFVALIRHEKIVQTARLFCVRIFFIANKPSISHFVKNQQTTDNQPLAQNYPFLVPQKPPKTSKKAT